MNKLIRPLLVLMVVTPVRPLRCSTHEGSALDEQPAPTSSRTLLSLDNLESRLHNRRQSAVRMGPQSGQLISPNRFPHGLL